MKKYFKYGGAALAVMALIFFIILKVLSLGATEIFNKAMAEQGMLKGTITVEEIHANIFGEVTFNNLTWKSERGATILEIPEGSFKVRIFDVLTGNFKSTTIQKLSLKDASISITLDEKMNVDFIRHSQDFNAVHQEMKNDSDSWEEKISRVNKSEEELKEIGERRRKLQQLKIEKGWKNFNLEGRKINCEINLENCQFEIFYPERHYLLRGVKFETKVNTDNEMTLQVFTGTFGGTMIGRGMSIQGNIDFKPEVPQCNLLIVLQEVDPSSLGLGLNIHDEMTLSARFTGAVSQPVGKGKVEMKELNLPGISFQNVAGDILYQDATLKFTDVFADVYGGKLEAYGDYNMDTRYYNIYGHGKKLKAYTALPKSGLHCDVELDLSINSKGNSKETVTSGSFVSGKGHYSILMFKSLSGKFRSAYNDLRFYDVVIDFGDYKFTTDAFSIVDKKLHLDPIKVTDKDGNVLKTYEQ